MVRAGVWVREGCFKKRNTSAYLLVEERDGGDTSPICEGSTPLASSDPNYPTQGPPGISLRGQALRAGVGRAQAQFMTSSSTFHRRPERACVRGQAGKG